MSATRLIVTAVNEKWAATAASVFCGNATSVIACDCEAGVERFFTAGDSPDGRPGVSILVFAFSRDALAKAVAARVGQCILTCPTTACYDGLPDGAPEKQIGLGEQLRYFGDGFQISKELQGRRFWRSERLMRRFEAPAMDVLAEVGLAGLATRPAGSLPYGQKRALELALALALEPRLLLLDEPTAGMGLEDVDRTVALIARIRSRAG